MTKNTQDRELAKLRLQLLNLEREKTSYEQRHFRSVSRGQIRKATPGFTYHGGMVFEIDSKGKKHPRKDITPFSKGAFKRKFK